MTIYTGQLPEAGLMLLKVSRYPKLIDFHQQRTQDLSKYNLMHRTSPYFFFTCVFKIEVWQLSVICENIILLYVCLFSIHLCFEKKKIDFHI